MEEKKIPTYVSLFSSAGIGCYGLKLAGFDCACTNEIFENRMEIQRANNKCRFESGYVCGDVSLQETKDNILNAIQDYYGKTGANHIDILFATPPCQGMSNCNTRKSDETKRNSLVTDAVRLVQQIQPNVFVFENVQNFLQTECTGDDDELVPIGDYISQKLSGDYLIYKKIVNFRHRGIPQNRIRTIVIGTKRSLGWLSPFCLYPVRQKEIPFEKIARDLPHCHAGETTDDMLHYGRPVLPHQLEWMKMLKPGQSLADIPDFKYFTVNKDGERDYHETKPMQQRFRRILWEEPARAVTSNSGTPNTTNTIHPEDNRVLSCREIMRIQTIPDSFRWCADQSTYEEDPVLFPMFQSKYDRLIRECVGEAVPTHFMEQVGQNYLRVQRDKKISERDTYLRMMKFVRQNSASMQQCRYYMILHPEEFTVIHRQLSIAFDESAAVYIDICSPNIRKLNAIKELINNSRIRFGCNLKIRMFNHSIAMHRNPAVFTIPDLQRLEYGEFVPHR